MYRSMNKIKFFSLIAAASILISSCSSYSQAAAGLTGAAVGSRLGRDVGYLAGGWRFGGSSSALGSLIGAGVGAALGVGIHNSIEQNRERRMAERNQRYDHNSQSSTFDDYQIGGGAGGYEQGGANQSKSNVSGYSNTPVSNGYISISPISYMDADGDGYMSKGEPVEVETYITNVSGSALRDVTIAIDVANNRYVTVSNPINTSLHPGQKIRYTGRIYCQKRKSAAWVNVCVSVYAGGKKLSSTPLPLSLK